MSVKHPRRRPERRQAPRMSPLAMALGALASAGAATAGTVLEPAIDPLHINQAQQGLSRAVGSISFANFFGDVAGSGSGTVINVNSGNPDENVWIVTAAHVLAEVGLTSEGGGGGGGGGIVGDGENEPELKLPGFADFSLDNNFFTSDVHQITEWYLPRAYDGTVVTRNDIAVARLDTTWAEYTGPSLSLYNRPEMSTLDSFRGLQERTVELAGFGSTGTGATGNVNFDGWRRSGQNRLDGQGDASGFIFETDFDVDPDDELYNPAVENYYILKNFGEFIESGSIEPRQNPREDFRVPYEFAITAGDSGGAIISDDALAGVVSYGEVIGTDEANGGALGGFFTFSQGFVAIDPWAEWIEGIVFLAENGGNPGAGAVGIPAYSGGVFLDPIADNFDADDNAQAYNDLLSTYYLGYLGIELTTTEKLKLLAILPASSDGLTAEELIAAVGRDDVDSIEDLIAFVDEALVDVFGEPTADRADAFASLALASQLGVFHDRAAVIPGDPPALPDELPTGALPRGVVPEPTTGLLLAGAVAGLLLRRRA